MRNDHSKATTNAARILLESYGYDSLSYFSLHEKKKFYFSSTGMSFLSYIVLGKVALVSGDPIGPKEDIPILLNEFMYFIKGASLTGCFVGLHENTLPFIDSLKYNKIHIGDEAILQLSSFQKDSLKKRVRRAERHIENLRITCKIYKRKDLPIKYLQQIETISKDWLQNKGGKERGFSMTLGRIPKSPDIDCEFVLAIKESNILGYLTLVPSYASQSLSLDAVRKRSDTPNGLNEFLLLQAFDYYKEKNIKTISLNFAAFYNGGKQPGKKPFRYIKAGIYKLLSYYYKTNKLYSFNEKFKPDWQSRYFAFEKKRYFPHYLFAIMKTELNI